jgi:hypothetical protein
MTKSSTQLLTQATKLIPPPLFALTITLPPSFWTTYLPTILWAPLTYSHANLCLSLSLSLRGRGDLFCKFPRIFCQGIFGIRVLFLNFFFVLPSKAWSLFPQPIELVELISEYISSHLDTWIPSMWHQYHHTLATLTLILFIFNVEIFTQKNF